MAPLFFVTLLVGAVSGLRRQSEKAQIPRSPTSALEMIGASSRVSSGSGVNIYIVNSGIQYTHSEFGGRAKAAYDATKWFNKVCSSTSTSCGQDVNGRGTNVASAAGGKTYGVAPQANLFSVKVIKDDGSISEARFLNGLSHVVSNARLPAVVVLPSMVEWDGRGEQGRFNSLLEQATSNGIVAVAGAGNIERSACAFWPGANPLAITVGSTEYNIYSERLEKEDFSNYGACVDVYAPGSGVYGAMVDNSVGYMRTRTGVAAGMVAGAAATLLSKNPSMAPSKVREGLLATSLDDEVYIEEHLVRAEPDAANEFLHL